ncbi:MAG: SPFH domain-containing protein [Pseudomonadota bacterium]
MTDFAFGFDVLIIALVVLLVLVVLAGVKQVPQGFNFTIERFGRYQRSLTPGLGFIIPFVDRIGHKMNMMEGLIDIPSQDVITKDNATVTVDGVTFFQVMNAARASYEVNDVERAILNLTMTNIRTVMGSMDLDELLSQRDEINARLLTVVDAATEPWGVKVTRIEIKDMEPPRDLTEAMGRQMKAERDRRAAILEAEGLRQSEVLRAEGEKQALVLEAEGRREAAFRDAEARERLAEAEAKATELVSEAVRSGDVQALNYFVAEKYVGALKELAAAPNQKVFMLPVEATSVLGVLGGIGEIAKSTFGSGGDTPPGGQGPEPAPRRTPSRPDPLPERPVQIARSETGTGATPAESTATRNNDAAPQRWTTVPRQAWTSATGEG